MELFVLDYRECRKLSDRSAVALIIEKRRLSH
jgi:hypothetical protein